MGYSAVLWNRAVGGHAMHKVAALAAVGLLTAVASAAAEAPSAVVENVTGKPAGVEFMDYVAPGKVIELGPQDSIVLGYLKSCWRETITGGTVTVGTEQSTVKQGKVERAKVGCDGGQMQLTAQQASQSAGMVFRDRPRPAAAAAPRAQVTLYGLSPLVEVKDGGTLIIERLDQQGEHREVPVGGKLVHGAFYDFAKSDAPLTAGGTYRASLGKQEVVFKVDSQAKPGPTPIVGRLLRFTSPT
jgi:hypothetical protein